MTAWHLGIDAVSGTALPSGRIARMNRDQSAITAPYTGNRLSQIDDQAAGWDDDCVPGWYFYNSGVHEDPPNNSVEAMKAAFRLLHQQLIEWAVDIDSFSPGHPDWQRQFGHDALASAHGMAYNVAHDHANITVANRTSWANTMRLGASDGSSGVVDSALKFYALFTIPANFRDNYPERTPDPTTGVPTFYGWVDPTSPTTALALNALASKAGAIPIGTILGPGADWIDRITQ